MKCACNPSSSEENSPQQHRIRVQRHTQLRAAKATSEVSTTSRAKPPATTARLKPAKSQTITLIPQPTTHIHNAMRKNITVGQSQQQQPEQTMGRAKQHSIA